MSMFYELMMRKKTEIMYVTIKGSLTENDGVFSGFSASNYLGLQQTVPITQSSNLEFYFKFKTPASFDYAGNYPVLCRLNNGNKTSMLGLYNSSGSIYARGSIAGNNIEDYSYTPQPNTTYYIKLTYANGVETLTLYDVDKNVLLTKSQSITITDVTETMYIGVTSGSHQGTMQSIDLNNSYIKLGSTKYKLQAVVGYTVVGSPTIVDGVVSGFSSANYLTLPIFAPTGKWKFIVSFTYNSQNTGTTYIAGNTDSFVVKTYNNALQIALKVNGSSSFDFNGSLYKYLSDGEKCYCSIEFTGTEYKFSWSSDGTNWTLGNTYTSETNIRTDKGLTYGKVSNTVWLGTIIIKDSLIYKNNKLWFNGQQA